MRNSNGLVAACLLVVGSLPGWALAQPDGNVSLVGDCDDTYATKSDDEYICEQAKAAAENTAGETWVCAIGVNENAIPEDPDENGWAQVRPDLRRHFTWVNLSAINRYDRRVSWQSELILPPYAMRVSPVLNVQQEGILGSLNLSRIMVRVPDSYCANSAAAGDPHNVQMTPEELLR